MINLTNNLGDIIAALKCKAEHLNDSINELVNSSSDVDSDNTLISSDSNEVVIELLKEEQEKIYKIIDRIESAQDEDDYSLILLKGDELDELCGE